MSARNFGAKSRGEKQMVRENLREISRSFRRRSSCLRIFVRGVNTHKKKKAFSWADLYIVQGKGQITPRRQTCDVNRNS